MTDKRLIGTALIKDLDRITVLLEVVKNMVRNELVDMGNTDTCEDCTQYHLTTKMTDGQFYCLENNRFFTAKGICDEFDKVIYEETNNERN